MSSGAVGPLIFMLGSDYPSGSVQNLSMTVADVNDDGKPDLLVGNDSSVSVYLGNGDGTFQPAVSYPSGGLVFSIAVSDLNGDGKLDLVVVNECPGGTCSNSNIGVLLGNGDGTFRSEVTYLSGGSAPNSVAVGDVNGDGNPDIVVANECDGSACSGSGWIGVLLGNGDGTFRPPLRYGSGGQLPIWVAIGDVNRDGKSDLVVANANSNSVSVLLGNGDGTFQTPTTYGSGGVSPRHVALGDLNGDGRLDIVVANAPNYSADGTVGVLLGNGNGTFQTAAAYDSGGSSSTSVAIADVNGDGKPDLLVTNLNSYGPPNPYLLGVLLANGDGTFQPVTSYDSGGLYAWSVAVADVNQDGKPDLLVANLGAVGVLLNNHGAPSTTTTLVSSLNPVALNKPITYTATVVSKSGAALNGTVSLVQAGAVVAVSNLTNNKATFSTSYTSKYRTSYTIAARYSGDFHKAEGSQSASMTEYVSTIITNTVVTTSGSPSLIGRPVTFTATVMPRSGTVPNNDHVTFSDGTKLLGSVALINSKAAYTTSKLSAHNHSIIAAYVGDNTFEPSRAFVLQVVDLYSTTTTLASSPNPSTSGQSVTLTAKVSSAAPGGATGKVGFKNGTTILGSATLSGGQAVFTTTKLPIGTLTLTASYSGDAQSAKSSGTATHTVN
jgi:hypothetical protein